MKRLLVIIPDIISAILEKGEYQPGYYNPGNEFEEVHLLLVNADRPDLSELQYTVGTARLFVHNLPEPCALYDQPWEEDDHRLLKEWVAPAVELARLIRPQIVRCHAGELNVYVALRIRQLLGVPYVVSLHINPDINATRRYLGTNLTEENQKINRLYDFIEREGLTKADLVLPVYRPILPYLERLGVTRTEVCYNVLDSQSLQKKIDYTLHTPVRIISVGRQFAEKNPGNLLRAIATMPGVEITLVGTGAAHNELKALAIELGLGERARFMPAVPNAELCQMLADHDIFAIHSDYWELNKSVLEAMLTGLPLVMNRSHKGVAPELLEISEQGLIELVDNTPEAYRKAISGLIEDNVRRERVGHAIAIHAAERYAPEKAVQKYVEIYRRLAIENPGGSVCPIHVAPTDSGPFTLDARHTAALAMACRPLVLLPTYQLSVDRRDWVAAILRRTAFGRRWLARQDRLVEFLTDPFDATSVVALVRQFLEEIGAVNTPAILAGRSYEPLLSTCRALFREVHITDQPLNECHELTREADAILLVLPNGLGSGIGSLLLQLASAGPSTIALTSWGYAFSVTAKSSKMLTRYNDLARGGGIEWAVCLCSLPFVALSIVRNRFGRLRP